MSVIAKNYGGALYGLAADEGLEDRILRELRVLDEAFAAEPRFLILLSNPSIPKEERCKIVDDSFRNEVHPYVLNFLKLLTEHGYAHSFDKCRKEYTDLYNEAHGILPVRAVTAVEVSPALKERLSKKLCAVTGKTVDITYTIDPDCIGGIRLDMDGSRLDGTVRRRLDDLRDALKSTVV